MNAPSRFDEALSRLRLPWANVAVVRVLRAALLVGLCLAGIYLCVRLTLPFFTPLAAAFALAVLFSPLHLWMAARIAHPSLAALATVLIVATLALALLVLLLSQLVREAAAGAILVRGAFEGGLVQDLLKSHPAIAPLFQRILDQFNAAGLAADAAARLTNISASMLRGSVVQLAGGLLTFYLLFYFLRDRAQAIAVLRSFLPFADHETTLLFTAAVDTVNATVFGMVVTGAVLGLLGGVIFAAVGLPAPVLWGSVMAVFAILPVLGIGMIWMPAAAWLALNGEWAATMAMTVAFTALSIADSVVYPYLVGNRMRLHTAIAFIAAIGGLIVFGPIGFVAGPLVVVLTLTVNDILSARGRPAAVPSPIT
ncbi:MAG: AI-2E family transporter [Rhodospirillaceae bacterium]